MGSQSSHMGPVAAEKFDKMDKKSSKRSEKGKGQRAKGKGKVNVPGKQKRRDFPSVFAIELPELEQHLHAQRRKRDGRPAA